MDPGMPSSKQTESWTNEKHVRFLNSMEASFIRTMLETDGHRLRMDRFLPDCSESTLDLKTQRRKKDSTSVDQLGTKTKIINSRFDKRCKRSPSSHSYDSSKDQVVPQL